MRVPLIRVGARVRNRLTGEELAIVAKVVRSTTAGSADADCTVWLAGESPQWATGWPGHALMQCWEVL